MEKTKRQQGLAELVFAIKKKKEFSEVDDGFVVRIVEKLLKKGEKKETEIIKKARALLRKVVVPMPQKFYKKIEKLEINEEVAKRIVMMNRATFEREKAGIYPWLVEFLENKGKTFIDFGCGVNLIALWCHGLKFDSYIGYDIDNAIVRFLNKFAKKFDLNAKVFCCDIIELLNKPMKLENAVGLFLKVVDGLEEIEPGISENIIELDCKKIVSFSLRSWGGKRIKQRWWFEKLLNTRSIEFEKIIKENEVFYVF